MNASDPQNDFTIERHGEVTLITAAPIFETMDSSVIDQASALILEPLRDEPLPLVIVDLTRIDYFGSAFLSLLLRVWKLATVRGGLMVLAGVSERARELLRVTSLDMVWPIYASREEALEALSAD